MLPEPDRHLAWALFGAGEPLLISDFWLPEETNVLWVAARRGTLTAQEARESLALLGQLLPPTPTETLNLHGPALDLSLALGHPAYDTLYLAFARAVGARAVIAADRPLAGAVARHPDPAVAGMVIPLEEWARAAGHLV